MAAVTPTEWRGFLIPDPRVTDDNIDTTNSTFTQTGPRAGVPEDTDDSAMVLQATGDKTNTADIEVRAYSSGYPGINTRGGGFLWRNDATTPENWRGWMAPNVPFGHEWLGWSEDSGVESNYDQPHVMRLASGVVLAAYRRDDTNSIGLERVGIAKRTVAGVWTWKHVGFTPVGTDVHTSPYPCLVQLPSGRVLCLYWIVDTTNDLAQVQVKYSDDDGDTWATHTRAALDTEIGIEASTGYTLHRLRAAYNNGQILLVCHIISKDSSTDPDAFAQYASDDMGGTFTQIEVLDHTAGGAGDDVGQHDLLALRDGGFLLVYLRDQATADAWIGKTRILADAYFPITSATETDGLADHLHSTGVAVWRGEDGAIYVHWVNAPHAGVGGRDASRVETSTDEGATWAFMDDAVDELSSYQVPRVFHIGEDGTLLEHVTACEVNGQTLLIHEQAVAGAPAHAAFSIGCLYLGGSSTVTMPSRAPFRSPTTQHGWLNTYIPLGKPGGIGHYTKSTTASPTETLVSTGLRTSATVADAIYYTRSGMTSTLTDCVVVLAYLTPVAGGNGASGTRQRNVALRAADGAEEYNVDINIMDNEFEVWDREAATIIGTAQTVDTTGGIWILAAIRGSAFACWYRAGGPSTDLEWATGPTDASLTDGGAGAADYQVEFGSPATINTMTTDWHQVSYGVHVGLESLSGGQQGLDELATRPFCANYIGIDDAVKIRAVDGPATVGDEWDVPIAYAYPIRAIDPALYPSPRYVWRSTDTTQNQIIWEVDPIGEAEPETRFGGIYLGGINFATATLAGWDGSTWKTLASINARVGATVSWIRYGSMVIASTTDHEDEYMQLGEMVGGTFKFDGTYFRKIERHSEGMWNTDTMRSRVYLEGITDAEPASGSAGEVWAPNVCMIWNDTTAGEVSKYRLTIDSQTNADGYHEIGTLMIGRFLPLKQYSWGRSVELMPNVDLSELADGTRYSRVRGPARRTVALSWRDGVDTSQVYGGDASAIDYFSLSSNKVGVPQAAPLTFEGLIHRIDGEHTPVVYLPSVTTGRLTLRHREEMMYCRIREGSRRESVVGDERAGEVFRIQTVTLEEEV